MSLPKFPPEAQPVLDILRDEVPRPESTDVSHTTYDGQCIRFPIEGRVFADASSNDRCCALGLHPQSLSSHPVLISEFAGGRCDARSIMEFWVWFDSIAIEDTDEALDFIWGKDRVTA